MTPPLWFSPNGTLNHTLTGSKHNTTALNSTESAFNCTVGFLGTVYIPIIMVVGLCGNALSILTILRGKVWQKNVVFYLVGLAVADSVHLLMVGAYITTSVTTNGRLSFVQLLGCWPYFALAFSAGQMSSLITMAFTVDRFCVIVFPHRFSVNGFRSQKVLLAILTLVCLINLPWIAVTGLRGPKTDKLDACALCPGESKHCSDLITAFLIVDGLAYSWLPAIFIIVCNFAIIVKLVLSRAWRMQFQVTNGEKDRGLIILFLMSAGFLSLTLPITLAMLTLEGSEVGSPSTWKSDWALLSCGPCTNSAINFFLYFFSGKDFRKALKIVLCCRPSRISPSIQIEQHQVIHLEYH